MTALSICRHVCMRDTKDESAVEQVFAGFPLKVMRRYSGLGRELHRYVAWKGTIRTGKFCNGLRQPYVHQLFEGCELKRNLRVHRKICTFIYLS